MRGARLLLLAGLLAAAPTLADPVENATPEQDAEMRAAMAKADRMRQVATHPELLPLPARLRPLRQPGLPHTPPSDGAATAPPAPPGP